MMQLQKVGRLAFRVEGDTWRAYYALTETMDGAIPLGSVAMRFVQEPSRRDQFILRHCIECAEADVMNCHEGKQLWLACFPADGETK